MRLRPGNGVRRRNPRVPAPEGPVVQFGVHAGLSSRRSRVQIPSGPLWSNDHRRRPGNTWGRVAQLAERPPEKRKVTGSTPVPTTRETPAPQGFLASRARACLADRLGRATYVQQEAGHERSRQELRRGYRRDQAGRRPRRASSSQASILDRIEAQQPSPLEERDALIGHEPAHMPLVHAESLSDGGQIEQRFTA